MSERPDDFLRLQEIDALKSVINAAQSERDATDGKRWSYFTEGGWAGDRLRSLLIRLTTPTNASAGVLSESDAVRRERELIEAKREGFEAGIYAAHCSYWACSKTERETPLYEWNEMEYRPFLRGGEVDRVVKQKYPLPQTRRPLRVTLSDGVEWSFEPRPPHDLYPFVCHATGVRSDQMTANGMLRTAHDYDLFSRILRGEMETVYAPSSAGNTTP